MIYSHPSEYAIRALSNLAQIPDGKYAMVKQIATEEQIPRYFLAKILHQVACRGLLRSRKGRTGGFALRLPADQIRLLDIVEALDGLAEYQTCTSGLGKCSNDKPCALHNSWKMLRSRILDYFGVTRSRICQRRSSRSISCATKGVTANALRSGKP